MFCNITRVKHSFTYNDYYFPFHYVSPGNFMYFSTDSIIG